MPANNESAGKKHSTKISKGGRYLKPLLVQVANAVVRSEKHPEIRNKYLQLKKRRGRKKDILVRYFRKEPIKDLIRITIDTDTEMSRFIDVLHTILKK